jgi:adenine-specific DNA-methyltransferase
MRWPPRSMRVDWEDLGFVCDGRFLFTQRSLEQTPLPKVFRSESFLPRPV